MHTLSMLYALFLFFLVLGAGVVSIKEGECRAATRIFLLGLFILLPYLIVGLAPFPYREIVAAVLIVAPALVVLVLFVPFGPRYIIDDDTPTRRIDERDIMFARRRLQPGSERFEEYYRRNPEKRKLDNEFRARPGLLAKGAVHYNPFFFAAAGASFTAVETFHTILEHDPVPEQVVPDPNEISNFIKHWGKKLGAVSVGITELTDYHLYSHLGRNEPYGKPVDLNHQYAIALTVEMDKSMLDHAPYGPTVMESAQQYLNAGAIAVQIAGFIRYLGYPARAHIDGNYRVVCPLVARDAGLGEIGRMGLLMTPELGPRVRLAVVTTDLPLIADERSKDYSVLDFCTKCEKCAVACPSKAIPFGNRTEIDGIERWQISSEACFTFWCAVGTDCGRCIKVCPYSHPNNLLHNVVRLGVRNSPLFRTIAIKMDDLVYGRSPPPFPINDWMDVTSMRSPGTISFE